MNSTITQSDVLLKHIAPFCLYNSYQSPYLRHQINKENSCLTTNFLKLQLRHYSSV